MKEKIQIGCNIRRLRILAGLSQVELAKLIEVDPSQISHYERNNRQPSIDNIVGIAKVLHVDTSSLLLGEGYDSGLDLRGISEKNQQLLFQLANSLRRKPNPFI